MSTIEQGKVLNADGDVVIAKAVRPSTFLQRARGLLGYDALAQDEGWWFERCSAVHSFGMRIPIDVLHLDAQGKVVKICSSLKPWSFSWAKQSRKVLELSSGAAEKNQLHIGQTLRFTT